MEKFKRNKNNNNKLIKRKKKIKCNKKEKIKN